ncbi:MAG: hypothetical protein LBU16_08115 [Treponema sp.]|nr:hypothetical protein [Treponema sp.]
MAATPTTAANPAATAEELARLQEAAAGEAPPELFRFDLGDSEVSMLLKGSWKGTLAANWGLSHSEAGWQAASTDSPLLFAQEADLTLSLWLRERWFLEAGFLDDHDLNTYRAGYQGREGEAVQYLGVGNAGLDYPLFPYLDLGGDSASSFGVYGRFGMGPWTLHSMVRYDSAVRVERVFVGNRERTYSQVSPSQTLRGRSFVLPQENITAPAVYLEDQNGDLRDASGRRWRRALPGEYGISARYGLLELTAEPKGMAAVYYAEGYAALGSYSAGTGFLGAVQDYFDRSRTAIQLWTYPQPGGGNGEPGTVVINGLAALAVYEKGAFSPFERQSRYAAPASGSAQAVLAAASTGERIDGFEVLPLTDTLQSATLPLLPVPETQRSVYELAPSGSRNPRDESARWPLLNSPGASYPGLYLPGGGVFNQDLTLRFTNYGPAGVYDIGTDVVPGSVEVFRGGLADPNISFNAGSGTVQLRDPVGVSETIRIAYLKRSEETRLGSLAAGVGAVYETGGPFSSALGLGLRWNLAGESFSEAGASSPGTVGFGGRAAWDYGRLKAGATLGLGFEQADTTGLYRIAGMEGSSEAALSLSPWSGFVSRPPASPSLPLAERADLTHRNYRNTDILGSTTLMPIDWSGNSIIAGKNSPYPVRDPIYQEVFVAEPEDLDGAAKTWAGFQVPLGSDAAFLEQARQIMVPFRFHGAIPPAGEVKVTVQFGALPDEDGTGTENPDLVVEKTLLDFVDSPSGDWTPASLYLADEDRRKLQGATALRVLIISDGAPFSGRVLVAKPVLYGSSWRPITVSAVGEIATAPDAAGGGSADGSVSLRERTDSGLSAQYRDLVNRLHPHSARQQVLEVQWNEMPLSDTAAGADGRVAAMPLENYRVLSFFVKGPAGADQDALNKSTLRFVIARGPGSLGIDSQTALDVRIPAAVLRPGEWSRAEVRYGGAERRISANGWEGSGDQYLRYRPAALRPSGDDQADQSAYMAAFLAPEHATTLRGGSFSLDEIILEEPVASYRANAGGSLEWTAPGTLVSVRGAPILENFGFRTALETGLRGDPFIPEESPGGFAGLESRSNASVGVFGAQVEGDLRVALSTDDLRQESRASWSAGHAVSRGFGPLSFRESFSDSPLDRAMRHSFGIDLSTRVFSGLDAQVRYGDETLERRWNASLGLSPGAVLPLGLSLESSAGWTEQSAETGEGLSNYGETWAQSWLRMVPDPGRDADRREASALFRSSLATMPLGAELSLEGRSAVAATTPQTQSETRGILELPLALGNYRIRFREERYYRRNIRDAGGSIEDDLSRYASSLEDSLPLWSAAPFHAFFDPDWGDAITRALEQSREADRFDAGYYSDSFSVAVTFPERYGLSSFFLPREAGAGIKRGLEKKVDTPLDMLSLNGSLGFSSLNIFGALGAAPLFRFYQTDEFRHAVIAAVNIPKNESPRWRFQDEIGVDFFGFAGAVLSVSSVVTAGFSGTAAGGGNSPDFLGSLALEWTVPAEKSLLGLFYDWCGGKARNAAGWPALSALAGMDYERLRKESLELVVDAPGSGDSLKVSVVVGHESLIRIFGRLSLSAFGKLNCSRDTATETLSFIATIGTTLNVTF